MAPAGAARFAAMVPLLLLTGILGLGLVAPSVGATKMSPWPFEVAYALDGAPARGVETTLRVTVTAHAPVNSSALLALPDGLDVEEDRGWNLTLGSGDSITRQWTLHSDRDGFWALALQPVAENGTGAWGSSPVCCLYGFTEEGGGAAGTDPEVVVPAARAVGRTSVATRDEGRLLELTYRIEPKESWMGHGTLVVQGQASGEGPGDRPLEVTSEYATEPDSDHAFTHESSLRIAFASGLERDPRHLVELECRVLHLDRHEGRVIADSDQLCDQERPFYMPPAGAAIGVLTVGAAALARAAWRPRRPVK